MKRITTVYAPVLVAILIITSEVLVAQTIESNTDRPGMDYESFDLAAARWELCRQTCGTDNQCKAYTYVKPGIQGPQARCWLKSGIPQAVKNECCISGVKSKRKGARID